MSQTRCVKTWRAEPAGETMEAETPFEARKARRSSGPPSGQGKSHMPRSRPDWGDRAGRGPRARRARRRGARFSAGLFLPCAAEKKRRPRKTRRRKRKWGTRRSAARRGCRRARQIDHRLVPVAGTVGRDERGSLSAQGAPNGRNAHILAKAAQARNDALDVAVYRGHAFAEGDARHSPGCVIADAGKRFQLRRRAGKAATVLRADGFRAGVQVARAAVVTKPFPELEHFLLRGRGERFHIRETGEKAQPVRAHRFRARLLQHDFRKPYGVGIARAPPGQVALCLVVPEKQFVFHADIVARFRGEIAAKIKNNQRS